MSTLVVLFFLAINVPLALRVYWSLFPFAVNGDATNFVGHWAKLKITAITGRVLATQRTTTVSGGGSVSTVGGSVTGNSHAITRVYDNFRLKDADGKQHDVELMNFQARVFEGDVVTVGYATKGGNLCPFVVLNHTTEVSDSSAVAVRQLSSPGGWHDLRLIAELIVGVISCFVIPIVIPLLIIYVVFERRQRKRFINMGIQPLWAATTPVAAQLAAST